MFAKVHPAEDVKSGNTGSCHDLVRYLEKETGEGQRFFSHTEQDISPERVIMDIDGNKKALGANDAKFFMLSLNPSQSEQMHLIGRKVDDFKELTLAKKKIKKGERFSDEGWDEIKSFHAKVLENMKLAQNLFISEDPKLARQLIDAKKTIREAEQQTSYKHFQRLKAGLPATIATSSIHLDIIRDYRRMNSYITAVAYQIVETNERYGEKRRSH